MLIRPLALVAFFVLGFFGCPSCGSSCDTEDGTLECYCIENPENCSESPETGEFVPIEDPASPSTAR